MLKTHNQQDAEVEDRRAEVRVLGEERRSSSRQKTILAGLVLFPGEETGRSVTISNRSDTGAKLRFGDVGLIPRNFTLIDRKAGLAHACHVIWRKMPYVGVEYGSTIDLRTDDERLARQLRSLWESSR